jgi:hypothetical protein
MRKAMKLAVVIVACLGVSMPAFAMGNSRKDTSISPNEDSLGVDSSRSETGSYAGTQTPEPPKESSDQTLDPNATLAPEETAPKYSK